MSAESNRALVREIGLWLLRLGAGAAAFYLATHDKEPLAGACVLAIF